jgi:DNA-binding NtrC family response regulator
MKNQSAIESVGAVVTVLSVSPDPHDHHALESIFSHSRWALYRACHLSSALGMLREREIGVVLCDRDVPPGSWTRVLESSKMLHPAPSLIVTARLADEQLWSEALNRGAYDVLAKPFDRGELVRSVSRAWLQWHHLRKGTRPLEKMRAAG